MLNSTPRLIASSSSTRRTDADAGMTGTLPVLFVVLAGAFLVAVVYWVWQSARLLLTDAAAVGGGPASSSPIRDNLLEEKAALLRALRDLEMDREAGKLSQADFERLNQRYRARAREVLRLLDAQLGPHREHARQLLADAAGSAGDV